MMRGGRDWLLSLLFHVFFCNVFSSVEGSLAADFSSITSQMRGTCVVHSFYDDYSQWYCFPDLDRLERLVVTCKAVSFGNILSRSVIG